MKKLFQWVSVAAAGLIVLAACAAPTPQVVTQIVPQVQTQLVPQVQTQIVPQVQTQIVPQVQTQVVEKPAAQSTVRLSGWVSSPAETALLESLLYRFSLANPGITVKYEPITGDYRQAMLTSISSGTEPDVFYVDIAYFQEWAKSGVLLPLDDLMATTGVKKDDFIPSLMNAFVFDGKVYGIPKDFNTLGLFYNKDMFAKAGVAEPTDAWTWDDMKAAAAKLTDLSDAKKPIYGLCTAADAGRFPIFVFQNGGSIMKPDYSDTVLDSPEAVAAANYYTGFRKDKTGVVPADVGESWQGTVFGKGQCAMVFEGGWLIPYLAQSFPAVKYGVALPPKGKAEGNLVFTVSWSISKNAKDPASAWKVVDFLTNPDSQKTVLESGFALPTRLSLKDSDYLKNNAAAATIFNGSLHGAVPFYWGPAGTDVNDQMGKALERVFLQNQAVDASLKQGADAIRKAIAQTK